MAISSNDMRFLIHLLPNLATTRFFVRSPRTRDYNCIGWAATRSLDQWWEPVGEKYYWPAAAPKAYTIAAFTTAFATVGYSTQVDSTLQSGIEKIALYSLAGHPTHAARQLANGWWTSKIGQYWDIEHPSLQALEGEEFGAVACILARTGAPAPPIGNPDDYLPSDQLN